MNEELDRAYQLALDEAVLTGETSTIKIVGSLEVSEDAALAILNRMIESEVVLPSKDGLFTPKPDSMYEEVKTWTDQQDEVSINDIQRHFRLTWSRAKRLLLALERSKIVDTGTLDQNRKVLN